MSESIIKTAYGALADRPFGKKIFSTAVSLKAPYFRTIKPTFVSLEPGRGEARMPDRWSVHNHLGTVHAIACCNLAELVAGTTVDISVPTTHRWIPTGMTVRYLKKARGTLTGVAVVDDLTHLDPHADQDVVVAVDITDPDGVVVVHADITMRVSPKP
jgi:acyl-coenzyme A thioesterase PaaI-like protein